jgi:hypothetical protein
MTDLQKDTAIKVLTILRDGLREINDEMECPELVIEQGMERERERKEEIIWKM